MSRDKAEVASLQTAKRRARRELRKKNKVPWNLPAQTPKVHYFESVAVRYRLQFGHGFSIEENSSVVRSIRWPSGNTSVHSFWE